MRRKILAQVVGLVAVGLVTPAWSQTAGTATARPQAPASKSAETQHKTPSPPAPQAPPTPIKSTDVGIAIEVYQKQIVQGTFVGVAADITNNSGVAIYFRPRDIQVVLAGDMQRGSLEAWLPTEYSDDPAINTANTVFCLQPRDTYRVFFAFERSKEPTLDARLERLKKSLSFVPGTYPITVEAKYWTDPDVERNPYRTVVASKPVDYAAPLPIVLFGAVLGGLLFTGLSIVRSVDVPGTGGKEIVKPKRLVHFMGSALLSLTVTILLSRTADTQFFIKVNVADFWGAIALGFLANYGGFALLEKMFRPAPREGAKDEGAKKEGEQTGKASPPPTKADQSVTGSTETPGAGSSSTTGGVKGERLAA